MDRYLVISTDCHAGLPPERYRDYLDPEFREAFDRELPIQIENTRRSEEHFLVGDINRRWRQGREQALSGAWDSDERTKVLDGDGIAGEVIFPDGITEMNTPPFGAGLSLPTEGVDPKLQWAGARAHNRWLVELCQEAPARRKGVAVIPALWDIDESVREIRKLRGAGLSSIMLPVLWGPHLPYHHDRYEPLWATCQDLDVAIHFHSGPSQQKDSFGSWPPDPDRPPPPGAMGTYLSEFAFWLVRPLTYMIWGGVFERHPRLKVAITEGQSSWVPELLERLDRHYLRTPGSSKLGDYCSHLSMRPSDYFRRNVRIGASSIPPHEMEMRYEIGLDCLMWGSDFPHPEGSWPNTLGRMKESFTGIPEDEIEAILGGTATTFYGFDPDALAPLVAEIGPVRGTFAAP